MAREGDEEVTEVGGGDEWRGYDTKVRKIMNEVGGGGPADRVLAT